MAGIDRATGRLLDGWSHVVQSILVIITTAYGEPLAAPTNKVHVIARLEAWNDAHHTVSCKQSSLLSSATAATSQSALAAEVRAAKSTSLGTRMMTHRSKSGKQKFDAPVSPPFKVRVGIGTVTLKAELQRSGLIVNRYLKGEP